MSRPEPSEPDAPSSADADPIGALVLECLERVRLEGTQAVESVCNENPVHADALRSRLQLLLDQLAPPTQALPETRIDTTGGGADRIVAPTLDLGDRYAISGEIGRGGMGIVYSAEDLQLRRKVAIKVLPEAVSTDPAALERFRSEARHLASLNHPNIATVHALENEENTWFIVLEYIPGETLDRITAQGKLSVADALHIARQIADALAAAHQGGTIHRDLKPSNVKRLPDGSIRVLDFGIAKHYEGLGLESAVAANLTPDGCVLGTYGYMSPEQLQGEDVDPRADIWSFGCVVYELLSGTRAFPGKNVSECIRSTLEKEPDWAALPDETPGPVRRVLGRCLRKNPTQRYPSAIALQQVMEALASDSSSVTTVGSGSSGFPSVSMVTAPRSSFVGRRQEVEDLARLLMSPHHQVVTLTGAGGLGKTRLALEVSRRLEDELPGGCWFADLSEVNSLQGVSFEVASAFGVPLMGDEDPQLAVASIFEYRDPLLLILDNFEQAVQFSLDTVDLWRRHAPHVQFLVTSRILLGLTGEREYVVPSLSTPSDGTDQSPSDLLRSDSVRLFVERCRDSLPEFELDAKNAGPIAQICRELEGSPLALELAAARINVLGPAALAGKLEDKLQFLRSERRDVPPRQRTLESAIEWSYDLLTDAEKDAFLQSTIFRDGFTLSAARAVLDLSGDEASRSVLDVLQSLREKSLITTGDTPYGVRFTLYSAIREYGEAKWRSEASPEAQRALTHRMASYSIRYAEKWAGRVHGKGCREALDRLSIETENLLAVYEWGMKSDHLRSGVRALLALAEAVLLRGPIGPMTVRLERAWRQLATTEHALRARVGLALARALEYAGALVQADEYASQSVASASACGDSLTYGRLLLEQGRLARNRGRYDEALTSLDRSEQSFLATSSQQGLAAVNTARGLVMISRGELASALFFLSRARQQAQALGDKPTYAACMSAKGRAYRLQRRFDLALAHYVRAESISREIGDRRAVALHMSKRAFLLFKKGDYDAALETYDKAERLARQIGDRRRIVLNLTTRAHLLRRRGENTAALRFHRKAAPIVSKIGDPRLTAACVGDQGCTLLALGQLEPARKTLEEAVEIYRNLGADRTHQAFELQVYLAQVLARLGHAEESKRWIEIAQTIGEEIEVTEDDPDLDLRDAYRVLRELSAN